MLNTSFAVRYAKCLYEIATEHSSLNHVYNDIKYLHAVCLTCPDFMHCLRSPLVSSDIKAVIIKKVMKNDINNITEIFIKLILKKNREDNLPAIFKSFLNYYNEKTGIHKVKLTAAKPLSPEAENIIICKLKKENKFPHIELETVVDTSLIGGFIIEIDNYLCDTSVVGTLGKMEKQLIS